MGGKSVGSISGLGIGTRLTNPVIAGGTLTATDLADCEVTGPLRGGAFVEITAEAAVTLTAAQLSAGLILFDCGGEARAVTTPTGALLSAAFPRVAEGEFVRLGQFVNTSDADETATITAGADITLVGTAAVGQGATVSLTAALTSADDDTWTLIIET